MTPPLEEGDFEACPIRRVFAASRGGPRGRADDRSTGANGAGRQQGGRAVRPAGGASRVALPPPRGRPLGRLSPRLLAGRRSPTGIASSQGAQYLVFPETAFWWLDYYGDLKEHLEGRYRLLSASESCQIYDIRASRAPGTQEGGAAPGEEGAAFLLPRRKSSAGSCLRMPRSRS